MNRIASALFGAVTLRRSATRVAFTIALASAFMTSAELASASIDQTPPNLTVPVRPSFVVGNVVDQYTISGDGITYYDYANVAQLIKYSASDNVGVCSYDIYSVPAGDEPQPDLLNTDATQVTRTQNDYTGEFGGGSMGIIGYTVTARDCSRNATTKYLTDQQLYVIQENGVSATGMGWKQPIKYSGTWKQGNCLCALADHTAFASGSGATASFARTFEQGDQIAFVMAKGPGRGRAGIRIDGSWVATIDTFAATNTNRVVVFARKMTAGTHTVTLVNYATPGRPRIDLDAILFNTSLRFGF